MHGDAGPVGADERAALLRLLAEACDEAGGLVLRLPAPEAWAGLTAYYFRARVDELRAAISSVQTGLELAAAEIWAAG